MSLKVDVPLGRPSFLRFILTVETWVRSRTPKVLSLYRHMHELQPQPRLLHELE